MSANPAQPPGTAEYQRIEQLVLPDTVAELVEQAAQRFGQRQALSFFEDGISLSYAELATRVRKLAHGLSLAGVRHGAHVAVLLSNRVEFPLTWLALARLGAVMVPVITSSTAHELGFILKDADVSFLIVEQQFAQVLNDLPARPSREQVIVVGSSAGSDMRDFSDLMESGDAKFVPTHPPARNDLLNIQYTSGTTGMPKGAMQSHRFWIVAGTVIPNMWRNEMRVVLSDHPFYYIDPQWMLIAGLYSGARVEFSKGMSAKRFMEWVRNRQIELAWFPDPLLKLPESESDGKSTLKLFMTYHFNREMTEAVERRFNVRARECYGMTEIGCGLAVPYDIHDQRIVGTCGLPAPYRRCRIVDGEGHDVTPGRVGELWITGDGLFDGYYNRPEANAEVFVDGWFRTGDLFVQDEHGYYRIVGRLKDMVKRSGENISAIEVERVLMEMPFIAAAAVVPVPDPYRDEEVKAYVRLREGFTPEQVTPRVILEHCSTRLAKFKLPRYIAYVAEFPHTASDKIAKHLLVRGVEDLRVGAFDCMEDIWR